MGGQKSEPNRTKPKTNPNPTEPNRQANQPRQIGKMYCFSLISISPCLYAYLCAYLCAYLRACASV